MSIKNKFQRLIFLALIVYN